MWTKPGEERISQAKRELEYLGLGDANRVRRDRDVSSVNVEEEHAEVSDGPIREEAGT